PAAYGSDAGTDMFRPSPTRFIHGTSDRHSAAAHDLESALHHLPDFIWCFKSLQYNIEHGCFLMLAFGLEINKDAVRPNPQCSLLSGFPFRWCLAIRRAFER